jgi:hypothetical protein
MIKGKTKSKWRPALEHGFEPDTQSDITARAKAEFLRLRVLRPRIESGSDYRIGTQTTSACKSAESDAGSSASGGDTGRKAALHSRPGVESVE